MKFLKRSRDDIPILPVGKEAELVMAPEKAKKHLEVARALVELKAAEIESVKALESTTYGISWAPVLDNLCKQEEIYKKLELELLKYVN